MFLDPSEQWQPSLRTHLNRKSWVFLRGERAFSEKYSFSEVIGNLNFHQCILPLKEDTDFHLKMCLKMLSVTNFLNDMRKLDFWVEK